MDWAGMVAQSPSGAQLPYETAVVENENSTKSLSGLDKRNGINACTLFPSVDDAFCATTVADSDDVDQSFRGDGDQRGAKRREAFSV
jgi:hypothetical protein